MKPVDLVKRNYDQQKGIFYGRMDSVQWRPETLTADNALAAYSSHIGGIIDAEAFKAGWSLGRFQRDEGKKPPPEPPTKRYA